MIDREDAANALLAWWEMAGVEPLPPMLPATQKAGAHSDTGSKAEGQSGGKTVNKTVSNTQANNAGAAASVAASKLPSISTARQLAAQAKTLEVLFDSIMRFDAGALAHRARGAVVYRGYPKADVMLIGEAPGRDEDEQGKPFVGRSGQLLDKMFAAIGMGENELFISNAVFWRPPDNRTPDPSETALCLPFIERMIALAEPKVLVSLGASSSKSLLGIETGITRLRGKWQDYSIKDDTGEPNGKMIPLLPMFHPAFVLRRPLAKRECWQDLQSLHERLQDFSKK